MSSKPATIAFAAAAILGAALSATAQQPSGAAPQQAEPAPPAAGKAPAPGPAKGTPRQSQLPGDELFTPEERRAFFDRMKAAQTPEERATIQAERRATAEARAKEKGVTLPPPPGPAPGAPKAQ
jgi:Spy/CpxP family protein refolding chaperone